MSAEDRYINTDYGIVSVDSTWYGEQLSLDDVEVSLTIPDWQDQDIEPVRIEVRRASLEPGLDVDTLRNLLDTAEYIAESINEAIADQIEAIQERRKREEEERERKEAEQKVLNEERTEILLNELVGERVKVRHHGYKTMCYADVVVRERPAYREGEDEVTYTPQLSYTDQGWNRGRGVASWRRLDVKTDSGWRTVWDDGKDDLPEWDRGSAAGLPEYKPYIG